MYRRRSNSGNPVLRLMVLGMLIGVGYFLVDQIRNAPAPAAEATLDAARTAEIPTVTPFPASYIATLTAIPRRTPQAIRQLAPKGVLHIPTQGISTNVIDAYLNATSWDVTTLGMNAGHLQGTGWVDQPGNIVLAGHVELRDGRAGIFKRIGQLAIGDPILLELPEEQRTYTVRTILETEPGDLSAIAPTTADQLTLITCGAYDFLSDTYQVRVVVVAERTN
jgi:LPXTG-site transpeptidase (sortase) family protein